jgi:hypothetical protein
LTTSMLECPTSAACAAYWMPPICTSAKFYMYELHGGFMGALDKRGADRKHHETPTRKNFRLRQSKLDAARKALGTNTETETIERALDFAIFGERLASGTARARGRHWNPVFGETGGRSKRT